MHLQADRKTLLERVKNESRKEHKKLTKVSVMREYLDTKDFTTSASVRNNIVIDNTKLSPQKVAQIVIENLKNL